MVKLSPDLTKGIFQRRLNRFAALMEVSGKVEMVHIANSGRIISNAVRNQISGAPVPYEPYHFAVSYTHLTLPTNREV